MISGQRRRLLYLVSMGMVVMVIVGCGRSTTVVTPGGTVTQDTEGETVTLQQPGSTTQFTAGTQGVALPDDFDQDVPVYPDAKIVLVNKSPAMVMVAAETSDSPQQVYGYYEKELAANEWENNQAVKVDNGGQISARKGQRVCTVSIASKTEEGKTVVTTMVQSLPQR